MTTSPLFTPNSSSHLSPPLVRIDLVETTPFSSHSGLNEIIEERVFKDTARAIQNLAAPVNVKDAGSRLLDVMGSALNANCGYTYRFVPPSEQEEAHFSLYSEWRKPSTGRTQGLTQLRVMPEQVTYANLVRLLMEGKPFAGLLRNVITYSPRNVTCGDIVAVLFFPIELNGKLWGGIGFENHGVDGKWPQADMTTLRSANYYFWNAVEKIFDTSGLLTTSQLALESEQRIFAEAISRTANTLNQSHNLGEVLELIMDHIGTVVPHDAANIMLVDEGIARITAVRGYEKLGVDKEVLLRHEQNIRVVPNLLRMAETGQGIVVSNTHTSPDWVQFKTSNWINSYVSAPICYKGAIIGFLNLNSSISGFYNQVHMNRLQVFADQAATAIVNARLYEYAQQELAIRVGAEQELQKAMNELEARVERRTAELRSMNVLLETELERRQKAEAALQDERASLARRVEERTAELSAANAELAKTARMKDAFLANTSHELRTPLNAILNILETLQEGVYGTLNAAQVRSIHTVEDSTHHLLSLINDILDLSKIGAGKFELSMDFVQVEFLCQNCLELIREAARKKNIIVSLSLDTAVKLVWADMRRLKQVLVNLLSNAVKFTANGGKIGLVVKSSQEDKQVLFTVWDSGIGIPQEQIHSLFKPFVQLDNGLSRQYDGTGLGLALVYHIVELHGGGITVESAQGQGIRFTVALSWKDPDEENTIQSMSISHLSNSFEDSLHKIQRYLTEFGIETRHGWMDENVVDTIAIEAPQMVFLVSPPNELIQGLLTQIKQNPFTQRVPILIVADNENPENGLQLPDGVDYLNLPLTRQEFRTILRAKSGTGTASLIRKAVLLSHSKPAWDQGQPLVMVVDDNEVGAKILTDYLVTKGFRVLYAHNGIDAIEQARELTPNIILMDIQMPDMDGLEVIRRIRADVSIQTIPVIALTALAMPGDRERCLDAGANEYASKPICLKRMLEVIETYFDRTGRRK